ncbi:MAG TPA: tetratricopeptide repeat protein [Saprospiraceae bacterium]|nr:tetratricopeptide repeat protein [Saprospiraceae bacterium]
MNFKFSDKIKIFVFLIVFIGNSYLMGQKPAQMLPQEILLENELIDAVQNIALEKYDDALEKLKDIKDKIKSDGIAEFEMAKIYFTKGEYDEAEFYIRKALEKDDSKLVYSQLLVDILSKKKKYDEAAEVLEKSLIKNYYNRKDYYKVADFYRKAGETDKALSVLNKLEYKTKDDRDIELYKYNILLRSKRYKDALALVEKYLKNNSGDIQFLEKKALVYRLTNKEKEAEKVYKQILNIAPDNPNALSYLSAIKNFNKSEVEYIRGLFPLLKNEKIDEDTKIKRLMPFVSKVSEDGSINKVLFEAGDIMLKQYPESAKTNSLYADLLYNSGKVAESAKYYEKALENNKSNYIIWKQLMAIYTLTENWKALDRVSEEAINYYPNQVSGYYYAGRALINMNKIKEGLDYLDEAKDYASDNYLGEIKLMEAKGYLNLGKIDKSSSIMISLDDNFAKEHPYYWELKGDIEYKKGNNAKAMEYWNKSVKLGNTTKRLKEKMGE